MKTIFLPIYYRQQARNVLRNAAFSKWVATGKVRVIIFTASEKCQQYREEFSGPHVRIEPLKDIPDPYSFLDKLFRHLSYFYVDTKLVRHNRARFILHGDKKVLKYYWSLLGITVFGNVRPLRRFLKWCDKRFVGAPYYGEYFEKYHPDVVFVPHLASKIDRMFIRHAHKRNIPTVGMINSWDTIGFSKFPIRVLPTTLLVHNYLIKKEAERFLDMLEEHMTVIGIPHFDHYATARSEREIFFKRIGLDPNKRLILFAPFFDTAWQIAAIMQDAIVAGHLPADVQILIRQHPTKDMDMGELKLIDGITVTEKPVSECSGDTKTYTEVLKGDMEHLADTLHFADVSVNTCSTMTIDAAAFDTPIVNIAFDGWENPPFYESVLQFYDESRVHYQPILKSGGVRLAYSPEELIDHLNTYLKDPSLEREGRKRIVAEQCVWLDGRSGERMFQAVEDAVLYEKEK
ncbi:hypothetical protein COU17_02775 [Candidatus Kaiserbacteria bacterium CG10_big_fil_rev_8_21_14_0_10_49_17]|uniref:CDP-glycerol--glycerophosphate glycerophosphotransferase n=1 Tax=Candidatus Kaiserbacteria bacterium CG10_big_fil_rev_8_21_14_0_10_49_17 TaxID=1974609 RepID=A0A2M6WDY6_9BACT|nr:MAG: hypothetical protein COU17_02775 [Candidatus Kaiserbacteria bacterium CG10_big_fil_rev_8_21_14_0_10_49_17]